jgi:hypothetical protein
LVVVIIRATQSLAYEKLIILSYVVHGLNINFFYRNNDLKFNSILVLDNCDADSLIDLVQQSSSLLRKKKQVPLWHKLIDDVSQYTLAIEDIYLITAFLANPFHVRYEINFCCFQFIDFAK